MLAFSVLIQRIYQYIVVRSLYVSTRSCVNWSVLLPATAVSLHGGLISDGLRQTAIALSYCVWCPHGETAEEIGLGTVGNPSRDLTASREETRQQLTSVLCAVQLLQPLSCISLLSSFIEVFLEYL